MTSGLSASLPLFDRVCRLLETHPSPGGLRVAGRVTNTGALAWDNRALKFGREFRVGVRVFRQADAMLMAEERICLGPRSVNTGQSVDFDVILRLPMSGGEGMIVEVDVLKEGSFWFRDYGGVPQVFQFNPAEDAFPHLPKEPAAKDFLVAVQFKDFGVTSAGIVHVSGYITNAGRCAWSVLEDPEYPFLLGVRLIREPSSHDKKGKQEVIWEGRNDLLWDPVVNGDVHPFYFSHPITNQPHGEFSLEVGVVRERRFWCGLLDKTQARCRFNWIGKERAPNRVLKGLRPLRPGRHCSVWVVLHDWPPSGGLSPLLCRVLETLHAQTALSGLLVIDREVTGDARVPGLSFVPQVKKLSQNPAQVANQTRVLGSEQSFVLWGGMSIFRQALLLRLACPLARIAASVPPLSGERGGENPDLVAQLSGLSWSVDQFWTEDEAQAALLQSVVPWAFVQVLGSPQLDDASFSRKLSVVFQGHPACCLLSGESRVGPLEMFGSERRGIPEVCPVPAGGASRAVLENVVEALRSTDVILLGPQVKIQSPDWLYELQQAAYAGPEPVVATGKTMSSDGKVVEAGAVVNREGGLTVLGHGLPSIYSEIQKPQRVDAPSTGIAYIPQAFRAELETLLGMFGGDSNQFWLGLRHAFAKTPSRVSYVPSVEVLV